MIPSLSLLCHTDTCSHCSIHIKTNYKIEGKNDEFPLIFDAY